MDELRERYQSRGRAAVEQTLRAARGPVPFDDLISIALAFPLMSLRDLKSWLRVLKERRTVAYVGLNPGERVPKVGRGHRVSWRR
jgi:hypothetical protein